MGRTTVLIFAKGGAKVVAADVNQQADQETIKIVKGAGKDVTFVKTDVSKAESVQMGN